MGRVARRVLDTARRLEKEGERPSIARVSDLTGHSRSVVCTYVSRFRRQGLWPWPPDRSGGRVARSWFGRDLDGGLVNLLSEHLHPGSHIGLHELAMYCDVSRDKIEQAVARLEAQGRWRWQLTREARASFLLPAICRRVRAERAAMKLDQPRRRPQAEIAAIVADWRRRQRERRRA